MKILYIYIFSLTMLSISLDGVDAIAADASSTLSTSDFIAVSSVNNSGNLVPACSGKKAGYGASYVSIAVERMTVNKSDGLLTRVVNRNREAFGAATLTATYDNRSLSVSMVGKPVPLFGSNSSVDMGVTWTLLDRTPWVLRNANIDIKLGYSSDSTIDSTVTAFNGVTSNIPGYTLSTSLATGFAIAKAVDNLLFSEGRARDLLGGTKSLPLVAGQLCEGYLAIFAAENKDAYTKYSGANLVWSESSNDLRYNNAPIQDVSYAVVSVHVTDRFYPAPGNAFNDSSKLWAPKYQDVLSSLSDLLWVGTADEVSQKEKQIRSGLTDAHTLLIADMDLTLEEKNEIHNYAQNEAITALTAVKQRIKPGNVVTAESTTTALTSFVASESGINTDGKRLAIKLLADPKNRLPTISPDLGAQLNASVKSLSTAIRY